MSITAKDLCAIWRANPYDIPVRVVSRDIVDKPGYQHKDTFPHDTMMITNMYPYGKDNISASLWYLDDTANAVYLSDNFEFILLEGEELDKFMEARAEAKVKNLYKNLNHSGSVAGYAMVFVVDEKNQCIPSGSFLDRREDSLPLMNYYSAQREQCKAHGFGSEFQTGYNICLAGTIDALAYGLKHIYDAAREKHPNAKLTWNPVVPISEDLLKKSDKKSVDMVNHGVSNAYGLKPAELPADRVLFRTGEAALQFNLQGMRGLDSDRAKKITRVMDATLGVTCVSLLAGLDNKERYQLGSLPGDYKAEASHYEYHALGTAWLCHPMITNLVFDFARKCAVFAISDLGKYWQATEEEVLSCMMDMDVQKSRAIMDRNKEMMMQFFQAAWPTCNGGNAAGVPKLEIDPAKAREMIYSIFYNGATSIIDTPHDMTSNWTLDGTWIGHSEGDGKNVWRTINAKLGERKFPNVVVYN